MYKKKRMEPRVYPCRLNQLEDPLPLKIINAYYSIGVDDFKL